MPKVLKITSLQYLCNISRMNWVMKLMLYILIDVKVFYLQVDTFIFDEVGQTCPKYLGKFAMSLWHLKKEVRNEFRGLTALAGSNTTFMIYLLYIQYSPTIESFPLSIWNPDQLFSSSDCLCNITSLLLLQVTLSPCKLPCFLRYLLLSCSVLPIHILPFITYKYLHIWIQVLSCS